MLKQMLTPKPLTAQAFAPFGDVLEASGAHDMLINQGLCQRFHDRAQLAFAGDGRAGVSLFKAQPRSLPYSFDLVERHTLGSQCFVPMSLCSFLVIAAPSAENALDQPGQPQAFLTQPGQAINFHRGTWHGVLTPLESPGLFAVIDRVGKGNNLEEFLFDQPFTVVDSAA